MNEFDFESVERRYWAQRDRGGKRNPCPTCREPERLTDFEKDRGYQCDECADRAEGLRW